MRAASRGFSCVLPCLVLTGLLLGACDQGSSGRGGKAAPSLTCSIVAPSTGPETGGTAVTVTGDGFDATARLFVGAGEAIGVSVSPDGKSIMGETPPGTPGPTDVIVRNLDGMECVLPGAFLYQVAAACPTLQSVLPVEGPESGGTPTTLFGLDFDSPAIVRFGPNAATDVVVVSPTEIQCLTPAGVGTVDVSVENPGGCSDTLPGAFTYYVSPFSSCTPCFAVGPRCVDAAGGDLVTLTCDCGMDFDETTAVFVDGVALDRTLVSGCELEFVSPALTGGEHDIMVCGRWDCRTFAGALVVPECATGGVAVCDVAPPSVDRSLGGQVTITGCGFASLSNPGVFFGDDPATGIMILSDTQLVATAPPADCPEIVDVTVRDLAGGPEGTLRRAFSYQRLSSDPLILSVTRNQGPLSGGANVIINGTNLAILPAPVVYFGSTAAPVVIAVSSTQISCQTPAVTSPGRVDVIVEDQTTGCRAVLECAFEYVP